MSGAVHLHAYYEIHVTSVVLLPFHIVPFVGMAISAWFRALGTAKRLHRPVCYAECRRCAVFANLRAVLPSEGHDPCPGIRVRPGTRMGLFR